MHAQAFAINACRVIATTGERVQRLSKGKHRVENSDIFTAVYATMHEHDAHRDIQLWAAR